MLVAEFKKKYLWKPISQKNICGSPFPKKIFVEAHFPKIKIVIFKF
jgi:hypothetical protein